ncbi:MAG: LapA family protein [Chloroflexi bacterium]|nr:LapA family protein [Chloroflexota bacterium]
MLPLYLILTLAFAVVIAIFAVQNTASTTISFLAWHVENMAISVLVLIAAAIGAAMALVLSTPHELTSRLHHRSTRQKLKAAEDQNTKLQARVTELEGQLNPPAPAVASTPAQGTAALPAGDPPAPITPTR